jgi:hypothetical protein
LERSETKNSDNIAYIVVSLAILALLALFALRGVIVLHRFELPVLHFQANLYARVFSRPDYETEAYRIRTIRNALDAEFAKRGSYEAVGPDVLRKAVASSSAHTQKRTHILASIFLGSFGLIITGAAMRARRRLYRTREDVRRLEQKGVDGFIRLVGRHLDPGTIARVEGCPTPGNLEHAFSIVREKVNVPCSAVARLFPRGSPERLALLEYGKAKVKFAQDPKGISRCPGEEGRL